MKSKVLTLLKLLQEADHWITANQLSVKTAISVRSIKTYVSEINSLEPNTIISSQNGYKINKQNATSYIKKS